MAGSIGKMAVRGRCEGRCTEHTVRLHAPEARQSRKNHRTLVMRTVTCEMETNEEEF